MEASVVTTTLSVAVEILRTALALTVPLPVNTMPVMSYAVMPGAAIVTLYVPDGSPNI